MNNVEVFVRTKRIIAENLNIDYEKITLHSKFIDDLKADSLDIVELVLALEEEFDIEISDKEAEKITTVQDAINFILNKLSQARQQEKNSGNKVLQDILSKMSLTITEGKQNIETLLNSLFETLQIAHKDKFVFLLVGRTGVGKSSTINKLMGMELAATSRRKATTLDVEFYDNEINGIKFTVVDTPGLCDELPEEGNDYKYLELISSKVKHIDLLWFVTPIYEARIRSDELNGIKIITEAFGKNIWKHSIIIFTFADKADDDYIVQLQERTEDIREAIAKYTELEIANNIPSVAVDNRKSEITPDGKNWVAELYTQAFVRISERGTIPFLLATIQRLSIPKFSGAKFYVENYTNQKIEFDDHQKQQIKEKLISVIPIFKSIGGEIGSFVESMTSNFTGFYKAQEIGQLAGESIGENLGEKVDNFLNPVIAFFVSLFSK